MPARRLDDISRLQAEIDADPRVQDIVQRYKGARGTFGSKDIADLGYVIPDGYMFEGRSGKITEHPSNLSEFGTWIKRPEVQATIGLGVSPFMPSIPGMGGADKAATYGVGEYEVPLVNSAKESGMNLGSIGKWLFGKNGLDPTTLLLGGMSLLGDDGQERQSFSGTGADPVKGAEALDKEIAAIGSTIKSRGPVRRRDSYSTPAQPPKPVQIPGVPFQIGGALGMDPASDPQSLLAALLGTSASQEGSNQGPAQRTAVKRKEPV